MNKRMRRRPKTGMTRMRKRLKTRKEMEMGAGARRRARKSSKIMMTARREAKMKGRRRQ